MTEPQVRTSEPIGLSRPGLRRPSEIIVKTAVVVIAIALVVLFATRWNIWVGGSARQSTDDAYVRADITPLSAQVEGFVSRVVVNDFQRVKTGELLVQIDDAEYQAKVAQAEADLLGAQAAIENLKARKAVQHAQVAGAETTITATEADLERARLELTRQQALVASTFGTRQRLEQAQADAKRLVATLANNHATLDAQHRDMAVLDTQESQLRAEYKAKAALLALARINLGYTRIVAPVAGMVSERGVRVGQYVHAGSQVISVVPLDTVWVTANYKETQLTHVAAGQPADITVDTYPGKTIHGHVDTIAPASGSQFTLLPPDNATGNFTKVVQRIPVKIVLDRDNPLAGELHPGMSVVATILTDSKPPPR